MVALALIGLVVVAAVTSALARRALAVVAASAAAWTGAQLGLSWLALAAMALSAAAVTALTLDMLSTDPNLARLVAGAEIVAAMLLMSLASYAVFGSSGVKGVTLLVCVAASTLIGAASVARSRAQSLI